MPMRSKRATAASIRLRDVLWAIRRDRLRTARGRRPCRSGGGCRRAGYLAIQQALSAIRSHGSVMPTRPACTCSCGTTTSTSPTRRSPRPSPRSADPLFQAGSCASSTGPVASGECSRSCTRRRRRSVSSATTPRRYVRRSPMTRLRLAMSGDRAQVSVLGHTASGVGIISRRAPSSTTSSSRPTRVWAVPRSRPYVVGVLNGDVDNRTISGRPTACASPDRSPPTPR